MEDEHGIGGRKPTDILWNHYSYNDCNYSIGTIYKDDETSVKFIIDRDDYDKVKERSWHHISSGYVGSTCKVSGIRKVLYLHNLIMNRLTFDGKGTTESVDHINGIGTDNRKANLRICSQSQQNRNKSKRVRITDKLPKDIAKGEIPQNVWYIPSDGHHGDRFAVEIKGIPGMGDILWRTTSATKVSTREKLELAIAKRTELYTSIDALRDHERDSEL